MWYPFIIVASIYIPHIPSYTSFATDLLRCLCNTINMLHNANTYNKTVCIADVGSKKK